MTTGRIYAVNHRTQPEATVDLFAILRARRGLLFGLTLAGALGAAVTARFVPSVYESRVVLEIGRLGSLGQVEPATSVVEKLRLLSAAGRDGQMGSATLTVAPPVGVEGASGLVEVRARARRGEEARGAVQAATSVLLARHTVLFEEVQRVQQAQLDRTTTTAAAIERALTARASTLSGGRGAPGRRDDRASQIAELTRLYQEIARLKLELTAVRTQPTRVVLEPTTPAPIRPNVGLLAVLGAAVGLGVALLATLVLPHGSTVAGQAGPHEGPMPASPPAASPGSGESGERIGAKA